MSSELRLSLTLGLGLAEGWSPEPVTRSGSKLLRVFGSSRAGKPRDKDLLSLAAFYMKQWLMNDLLFWLMRCNGSEAMSA